MRLFVIQRLIFFPADNPSMNNATSSVSASTKALPLDSYKNNLLKAKTEEIDSYMKYGRG